MAVLRGQGVIDADPFYGLHLSGGTTDILYAVPDENGLAITRVGGTSDISAGQFIDRVGVALGLSFPAGLHLDLLARTCAEPVKAGRVFYKNGEISFSGMETQAQRQIAKGGILQAHMAQWVLATVWDGLRRLLDGVAGDNPMTTLVAAGGVLANDYLRGQLGVYCRDRHIRLLTAAPEFSCDNASGAAFWAAWKNRSK
jgi:N6-L-threonylcarbamoyladenine synthase